MSLASLMSETVTWLKFTPGAPDAHGVPVEAWTDNGDLSAYVEQFSGSAGIASSQEVLGGRDTVVAEWLVVVMPGTKITAYDRLLYRGKTLEVVGDMNHARAPWGESHVEIRARSVSG